MDKIAIKLQGVSKVYKLYNRPMDRIREALSIREKKYHEEYYALKKIDFEIKNGDTIGIIGENGAGKSTLLKIITGVLSPTTGNIEVNGKVSALLELGTGFNPEYTGIENIYLYGTLMGFSKEEIEEKVDSIIKFADIGEFIYQPVKTYSSGMFVRLAFAVSISIEPDILIVDEALSVGDAYFQAKSMSKMKELFEKGKTVLFVTHDTSTVKSLCRNAIYLKDGQVYAMGPSNEIVDLYENNIRNNMIASLNEVITEEKQSAIDIFESDEIIQFKENPEFGYRVSNYRQGNGKAVVTELEILDENNQLVVEAEFNQQVRVRMHVRFINDCRICIGYHIRDSKNIEMLGSNTLMEEVGEIVGKGDDRLVVDFTTKLPLIEGLYNISTVLSTITVHNRSAIFEDYTQNGYVFKVKENKECKIWNKVYIKNNVKINRS